jgi:hypothetical protein
MRDRTARLQWRGGTRRAVPDRDVVTGVEKPRGDAAAHRAESEHGDRLNAHSAANRRSKACGSVRQRSDISAAIGSG